MRPLITLALALLAGCQTGAPFVLVAETEGAVLVRTNARYALLRLEGDGRIGAHYPSKGEPLWIAPPMLLEGGGWWIVDLAGDRVAHQLPAPPEPWPAWIRELGMLPDADAAEAGIVWEPAP